MSHAPPPHLAGTPYDWPLADSLAEALEHVTLARAAFVRVQEVQSDGRSFSCNRSAYDAAARNLRARVRWAKALGASDDEVLRAAEQAYHSDRCQVCGRIFHSSCQDPRYRGLCGECLLAPS